MTMTIVPPPAVFIRSLAAADLPHILGISASVKGAPQWAEAAWLSALEPTFDAATTPRRIALAAVEPAGGTLLGFAVVSLMPPQAELETIAVARESQRRGIGRALLHHLAAQLVPEGIGELWLEVRASNEAALSLYHSAGFVQTGRRPRYYRDPEEDGPLLTLRLLA